ncbi:hypothetical protein D3C79_749120 [compost metagenome]
MDELATCEQHQDVPEVEGVGEIPEPVGDAVVQQAQQRALARTLRRGNPDQQHIGANQQQGQWRRHGELQQHPGQGKGQQERQIPLHHGQLPARFDPGQQPETEHELAHPAPYRQHPAGDIQGALTMNDIGQYHQRQQWGEMAPAAAGDRQRDQQRE